MPLNKVKPGSNMYQFITHTWNPLAGECPHVCSYCSTHKLAKRYPEIGKKYSGPVRLDQKAMKEHFTKDQFIFVVAQNDLFAWETPVDIILSVLEHCRKFEAAYLFQTKNPQRILEFLRLMPIPSVICTTIESNRVHESMKFCPAPEKRAQAMNQISHAFPTYVTIEPIMDFDLPELMSLIKMCNPAQVNIGADTSNNHLPEPSKEKLIALVDEIKAFTTIDKKINLTRILNS